jgi:hypothetical protein
VIWGMPAVNYDLMLQEFKRIGGKENQIVYWSRPLDGNNQTLTPNPDSIYFMAFYNTKDGPVVLEIPPAGDEGSINANIVTTWQMPLAVVVPTAPTRDKAVNTCCFRPATAARCRRVTSRCSRIPTAAMR